MENEDEANEPVDIYFTEHKAGPDNHENAIDFRRLNVQEEARKILFWLTYLRHYKSRLMRKIFKKN